MTPAQRRPSCLWKGPVRVCASREQGCSHHSSDPGTTGKAATGNPVGVECVSAGPIRLTCGLNKVLPRNEADAVPCSVLRGAGLHRIRIPQNLHRPALDRAGWSDASSDMTTTMREFQRQFGRMRRAAAAGKEIRIRDRKTGEELSFKATAPAK